MSYPDLSNKIKLNSKSLLEEEKEKKEISIKKEVSVKKDNKKLSEHIAILVSRVEKEKLEELAIKNERSVSYMVRKAIKETYKI